MFDVVTRLARARAARTIRRSGLLDAAFYGAENQLLGASLDACLEHYLTLGAAQGRRPHPLFDPAFYLRQTTASGARANPLLHFLRTGSRAGLWPTPGFDPAYYASAHPDVRLDRFEPLTHYAARGRRERRQTSEDAQPVGFGMIQGPEEPTEAEWAALRPLRREAEATIDIVMPVFAGRAETLRALHRVLSAASRRVVEVIVVNDASPDAAIASRLAALADGGHITLLSNETNRGFVASANRGMTVHPTRDVVLLNADTEVFGDWVDRLAATSSSKDTIGTVTPWSSDATILSYPIRLRPNHAVLETSDEGLDGIAAGLQGPGVVIPTAVGFCMSIKRACLAAVGPFDEARFGRGYGEENDFSRRAASAGWVNVAAPDVFVRHHGGVSFGAEKSERVRQALAVLARLHPGYLRLVRAFNAADPLRASRQRFDEARIRSAARGSVLTDAVGPVADRDGACGTVRVRHAAGPWHGLIDLSVDEVPIAPNLAPIDPGSGDRAQAARIEALEIGSVVITGRDPRLAAWLESIARSCRLPVRRP